MKELEHLCYKERLRELGLLSPEETQSQSFYINTYINVQKQLKGGCKEDKARLMAVVTDSESM